MLRLRLRRFVYEVRRDSYEECASRLEEIKEGIRSVIDGAIVGFVDRYDGLGVNKQSGEGGKRDLLKRVFWVRHEDWVKGEEFIDRIPRGLVIHDSVFKKVYEEGVEFVGGKGVPGVGEVKRYLKNRVVEDFAPEIAKVVGEALSSRASFEDAIGRYTEQINLHLKVEERQLKVQGETLKALKELRKGLKRRSLLDEWW